MSKLIQSLASILLLCSTVTTTQAQLSVSSRSFETIDVSSFEKSIRSVATDFRTGFKNIMGEMTSEEPEMYESKVGFDSAIKTFFLKDGKLGYVFCASFSEPIEKDEAEKLYKKLVETMSKCSFKQFYLAGHNEVRKNKVILSEFTPDRSLPKAHPIYNNFVVQVRMMSPPASDKWKVTMVAFLSRSID